MHYFGVTRQLSSHDTAGAHKLAETLSKNGSSFVGIEPNLVDLVWGKDRPSRPRELVKVHPEKYAGKSFQEKIGDLRKELEKQKKAGFVICMVISPLFARNTVEANKVAAMLDEIAWLFNLRGTE